MDEYNEGSGFKKIATASLRNVDDTWVVDGVEFE